MNKINVGIIGFGLSGRVFHTTLIKACDEFEIKKVFSSRESEVKALIPEAQVVSDIAEIINDENIQLVVVCGPTNTHFDQAKSALLAGKHVLVEKPFVVSSSEGEELIKIAKEKNLILSVFHNRRWDGDFLTVKKLIQENRLGTIKQFESHFDRWRPTTREGKWKEMPGPGSGILYDIGVHLIDQCLELFGTPDEVMADLEDQKNNEGVVDYFHIILKYKKMRAVIQSSSFAFKNTRFAIFGERGNFFIEGLDPQEERMTKGLSPVGDDRSGTLIFSENEVQNPTLQGQYLSFYPQLAVAIKTQDQSKVPVRPESALATIRIIEAAMRGV